MKTNKRVLNRAGRVISTLEKRPSTDQKSEEKRYHVEKIEVYLQKVLMIMSYFAIGLTLI